MNDRNYPRLLLLLCCLAVSIMLYAQAPQVATVVDKAVQSINAPEGIRYDFTVNITKLYSTSGRIQSLGQCWKFTNKDGLFCDNGTTAFAWDKKKNHVVMMTSPGANIQLVLTELLSKCKNRKMTSDGNKWKIELQLNEKEMGVKKATVYIDKQTYLPTQLKFHKGLIGITIRLSNFILGGLKTSQFNFNKSQYPHATIEQRE